MTQLKQELERRDLSFLVWKDEGLKELELPALGEDLVVPRATASNVLL